MIKWLIKKLTYTYQKKLVVDILEHIVNSKSSSIDNKTAEKLITLAIKSNGNKVTRFIVKD